MSEPSLIVRNSTATASTPRSAIEVGRSARLLVLTGAVLIAIALAPFAVGLASALVMYELFARPHTWLARRVSAGFATSLTLLAALSVVVVPLAWIGYQISSRVPIMLTTLTAFRAQYANTSLTGIAGRFQAQAANAAGAAADWLPGVVMSAARSTGWALVNWSIALLGLYYLLGSASASWPRFARMLPLSSDGAETLRVRFRDITQGMVAGTLLSSAVQGVSIGTGFWVAGLPDALFWGVCAGIATLVPVVGNNIVSIPAAILLLLRQEYKGVIAIIVFAGLFPPIIDRVVRATVSRRLGSVHPMITLIGALAGARIAGVAGLILGPVALAMFFALLEVYDKEYVGYPDG